MKMIKAPNTIPEFDSPSIFLAGSIGMGTAEQWQEKLGNMLVDVDCILLNPRRDDWDSSWVQSIDNPEFNQQVTWELQGLDYAEMIIFYFDPDTQSPITLMELGYVASMQRHLTNVIVCCPYGFWRKGNVDIICKHTGIQTVNSLEEIAEYIKNTYKVKNNVL
jgi:hypothetical protein